MTTRGEEIYLALHDWLVKATGLPNKDVVRSHSNAPEPEGNMIQINPVLFSDMQSTRPESVWNGTKYFRVFRYLVRSSIHGYGPEAMKNLTIAKALLQTQTYIDSFRLPVTDRHDGGMGVTARGHVRYLPYKRGHKYMDHAQLDVEVRLSECIEEIVPVITNAELTMCPSGDEETIIEI